MALIAIIMLFCNLCLQGLIHNEHIMSFNPVMRIHQIIFLLNEQSENDTSLGIVSKMIS